MFNNLRKFYSFETKLLVIAAVILVSCGGGGGGSSSGAQPVKRMVLL